MIDMNENEIAPTPTEAQIQALTPIPEAFHSKEPPKPLGYRVLVKPELGDLEEVEGEGDLVKHKSGLYLTAQTVKRERHQQVYGRVVAIGPLAYQRDGGPKVWGVEIGSRILFAKYGGTNIKHEGVSYVLLNDEDLLCGV